MRLSATMRDHACALALALVMMAGACTGDGRAAPASTHALRQTARWPVLATPIAFSPDGAHWVGAVGNELVEHDGAHAVRRWKVSVRGHDDTIVALPGGRWLAGRYVLERDGQVSWDGHSWGHRYGRFGSTKALAISDDGRVAIANGADSPSTCLCDRDRGTGGSSDGALVRLTFREGAIVERELRRHGGERFQVAASPTTLAVISGSTLELWPATGDGAATVVPLGHGHSLEHPQWIGDRYLLATQFVAIDRTDIVVLDRERGFTPAWTWPVTGTVRAIAVRPRPDGSEPGELAIAFSNYRARTTVEVDQRRVAIRALDGTVRAEVDLPGHPIALAWSPRGDALLVATNGVTRAEEAVTRFAVR